MDRWSETCRRGGKKREKDKKRKNGEKFNLELVRKLLLKVQAFFKNQFSFDTPANFLNS